MTSSATLPSLPAPGSARAWLLAARPATLTAAVAPVAVGAAAARASAPVHWPAVVAALAGALAIQVGTNFANDVFDFEKGADDEQRLGPPRAVQTGLLSPRDMRRGMVAAFALAMVAGSYLGFVAGPVIIAIGIVSILSGVAYTAGPYPLGYHGLGDLFVFLFFGLVAVLGTTYVAAGTLTSTALLAAVAVGALATNVLVVNNVRDRETDVLANKRTLVVRFGRRFGLLEYAALLAIAFSIVPLLVLRGAPPGVLLALLPFPFGVALARALWNNHGPSLNRVLAGSAQLLLATSALLALGLSLGR